jgi:hypothetical protein
VRVCTPFAVDRGATVDQMVLTISTGMATLAAGGVADRSVGTSIALKSCKQDSIK